MKHTAIHKFNRLIDNIEARCMAVDGPVSPTLQEATERELSILWELANEISDKYRWIKSSDQLPEENVSVLVFIPEEDFHITTGMWDVSQKWVLLDEYRIPQSEVTYWMPMVDAPEDESYNKTEFVEEEQTMSWKISSLQKQLYEISKQRDKLQEFKSYVHGRLDKMSIPRDPEPENNASHGCRIEGRLNFIEQEFNSSMKRKSNL